MTLSLIASQNFATCSNLLPRVVLKFLKLVSKSWDQLSGVTAPAVEVVELHVLLDRRCGAVVALSELPRLHNVRGVVFVAADNTVVVAAGNVETAVAATVEAVEVLANALSLSRRRLRPPLTALTKHHPAVLV